jgi:hypothetical protein
MQTKGMVRSSPLLMALVLACAEQVAEPVAPELRPQMDETEWTCIEDPTCEPDVPYQILDAAVYHYGGPQRRTDAWAKATHRTNWAGSNVVMTVDGVNGSWTHTINTQNYIPTDPKHVVNTLSLSGPCFTGAADGYVNFSSSWHGTRTYGPGTDSKTHFTYIRACPVWRDEELSYGDEDEPTEDGPAWCVVRTTYWEDTGEIISRVVLYCW